MSTGFDIFSNEIYSKIHEGLSVYIEPGSTLEPQLVEHAINEIWNYEFSSYDREEFNQVANARIPPAYRISDEMHEMIELALASSQYQLTMLTITRTISDDMSDASTILEKETWS